MPSKLAILLLLCLSATAQWPAPTPQSRPWVYWWWMAGAVDEANLTRELEVFKKAGIGGVHIVNIYGAKGYESRYNDFLSPRWLALLSHTVREARRLGLEVDMSTGSGWNFGGPNIDGENQCLQVVPSLPLQTKPCRGPVERAGPGGAGPMLNPFFRPAIDHYLTRFTQAFQTIPNHLPRAMYHDSFEYEGDWAPNLPAQFERRRGYALQPNLPELFSTSTTDHTARLKADYRETVSDLLLDSFTLPWVAWSHTREMITRNQAHGSPANWLDLYAAADIPETEMFGEQPTILISKFASSAAHVAGRPLVSAELGTWVREHFHERLTDLKAMTDATFLSGVNHVFFHGSCFSPADAPWPGWLFYASTQLNSRNPLWHHLPALTAYIARVQSLLQSSQPDNDLLLYWPIHDLWHDPRGLKLNLSVHNYDDKTKAFSPLPSQLYDQGFSFDHISDRQLASVSFSQGRLRTPGASYRALVVPRTAHMPVETLSRILALARAGATILFEDQFPADVPGLHNLDQRRAQLQSLLASAPGNLTSSNIPAALQVAGVRPESIKPLGLDYVRLRGPQYLLINRTAAPLEGWFPLNHSASNLLLLDPWTGLTGRPAQRRRPNQPLEIYLQLDPGQSLYLKPHSAYAAPWPYLQPAAPPQPITPSWRVVFLAGGPTLPPPSTLATLSSWTEFASQSFAGTARYTAVFGAPSAHPGPWRIALNSVGDSARLRLNGVDLGHAISTPYAVIAETLRPTNNTLEVEVTSLAANRIRALDLAKTPWRIFRDINFVNIRYKPFDASSWPLRPAGLLGPVTLLPLQSAHPKNE